MTLRRHTGLMKRHVVRMAEISLWWACALFVIRCASIDPQALQLPARQGPQSEAWVRVPANESITECAFEPQTCDMLYGPGEWIPPDRMKVGSIR